jgi:ABC-type multidrug transport system fused ATPase/permease subunit
MVSSNTITVGNLSSFLLYAAYIGVSLGTFSNFYSELNKSVGAAARIWEIIDREPVIPMNGKTQERVQSSLTDLVRRWSGTDRDSPRPHRIQGHPIQLPGPRRRPDLRKLPAGDLPPARWWPWWGPAVPARALWGRCCCACTTPPRARSSSTGKT